MKIIRHVMASALALLALMLPVGVNAWTISDAFATAGGNIIPLLERNVRLDMIDYYNSGMDRPSHNTLGGSSVFTRMDDMSMRVRLTDASNYQLAALPAGADTLVAVIATVLTPAPDSKMAVYTNSWDKELTRSIFRTPSLSDWLTAEGRRHRDEVAKLVPFKLTAYDYDPATATLTLTDNTRQCLSEEVYETVRPYLKEKLVYRWNGKKFTAVK